MCQQTVLSTPPAIISPPLKTHYFVPSLTLSNVMSLGPKIDQLCQFAKDHEPVIMCFTET